MVLCEREERPGGHAHTIAAGCYGFGQMIKKAYMWVFLFKGMIMIQWSLSGQCTAMSCICNRYTYNINSMMSYYVLSCCITLWYIISHRIVSHYIQLYYIILYSHIYIYCISLLYSISSWYIIHIHSQNPRWTHAAEAAGKSATSWGSEKQRIDIGFQVFNLSNYPLLLSYDENNIFLEIFVLAASYSHIGI